MVRWLKIEREVAASNPGRQTSRQTLQLWKWAKSNAWLMKKIFPPEGCCRSAILWTRCDAKIRNHVRTLKGPLVFCCVIDGVPPARQPANNSSTREPLQGSRPLFEVVPLILPSCAQSNPVPLEMQSTRAQIKHLLVSRRRVSTPTC